ncbi:hypothetical protein [Streptococcus fryi]
MILDTEKVEKVLLDKAFSGPLIQAKTGISRGKVSKLRNGDCSFKDMTIESYKKVQKWIDDENL